MSPVLSGSDLVKASAARSKASSAARSRSFKPRFLLLSGAPVPGAGLVRGPLAVTRPWSKSRDAAAWWACAIAITS